MTLEDKQKILKRHCDELAEYFDAVQILATGLDEENKTESVYYGSGNYFARSGMCHDFIGQELAVQIANKLDNE